jgi:hypothetical protein
VRFWLGRCYERYARQAGVRRLPRLLVRQKVGRESVQSYWRFGMSS